MNKALLLTAYVAAIGLAGPAYADPGIATGNDAQFLSTLTGAGLQHRAGDQVTVSAGRAVCQLMDAGLSPMDTVTAVQTTNPYNGVKTTTTNTGVTAKSKNGYGVATGPGGKTCAKGHHEAGCN